MLTVDLNELRTELTELQGRVTRLLGLLEDQPEPAITPVTAAPERIRSGGRPVAAVLSTSEWIELLEGHDGPNTISMLRGVKYNTAMRLRQKALKGEVIVSLRAPEIFSLLKEGYEPREVAEQLRVVLPTVEQAEGLLNAYTVLKGRKSSNLPKLPIAV